MPQFERVVIVGVGLLGGSIGLALRRRGLAQAVVGVGRQPAKLAEAQRLGAVDRFETSLALACAGADLAVVCTPVDQVAQYVADCQRAMPWGGLITDVGSTKVRICRELQLAEVTSFCGSHPLAGSDRSGVAFATADLLEGRLTVVTPSPTTPVELLERTEQLWQALGSRTVRMSPEAHDLAIARTSHLPHIVAAQLAASTPTELLPLAATGWCDTTRVAGGSVELWRQILEDNCGPVLEALEQYAGGLEQWMSALRQRDGKQLEQLLEAGKIQRDSVGN